MILRKNIDSTRLFRLFDYLKWNFKCQAAEYLGYKILL